MQLTAANARKQLQLATRGLLSASLGLHVHGVAAEVNGKMEMSNLYYAEEDRVTVNKTQFYSRTEISEEQFASIKLVFDTMTGATPNGRVALSPEQNSQVTVTTASGFSFQTQSADRSDSNAPWLSNFTDTRVGTDLEYEFPLRRFLNSTFTLSGGVSTERDYRSLNSGARLEIPINNKRSTFTLGSSINNDLIEPEDGVQLQGTRFQCDDPIPASLVSLCTKPPKYFPSRNKIVNSGFVGLTQIWNQSTLFQLNYSYNDINGYLSDPYKLVSFTRTLHDGDNVGLDEVAIFKEKRPDKRLTESVYFKMIKTLPKDALHLSYRLFWDSWQLRANTLHLKMYRYFDHSKYIMWHIRANYQMPAWFYQKTVNVDSYEYPKYFSADHRLGPQTTFTTGVKIGLITNRRTETSIKLDYMEQQYRDGVLPGMRVFIAQFNLYIEI